MRNGFTRCFARRTGAALPLVLYFALCAFLTAAIYLTTQMSARRPPLRRAARLQALLNARSGIWIGMQMLAHSGSEAGQADTLAVLRAARATDTTGMGITDSATPPAALDAQEPIGVYPFTDSSFGTCSLTLEAKGCLMQLHAVGTRHKTSATVDVMVGSRPFSGDDTVLYLETQGMPEGNGSVDGGAHFIAIEIDSAKKRVAGRFDIDPSRQALFKSKLGADLLGALDTAMQGLPVEVKSNRDFAGLPDEVLANVLVNAAFDDIDIRDERTIVILGDLQFTGTSRVENVEFKVGGEIKIYDKTRLRNVSLLSLSRIWFQDESVFEGSAVAMGDIEIGQSAAIGGKSTLVCFATAKPREGQDGTSPFSIHIRDRATVNGVVVDLNKGRGIQTEPQAEITGVLWAQGKVGHEGSMLGIIRAQTLVDRNNPADMSRNVMNGSIEPLDNIHDYPMPYFIGKAAIVAWNE